MACFMDTSREGIASSGGACQLLAWPVDGAADGGYSSVPVRDHLANKGA